MFVLSDEVVVSQSCVAVLAEESNLRLPATLTAEPAWRSADVEAARHDNARAELAECGLPRGELVESLRVICTGGNEVFAYVETAERRYRLHGATSGRSAVLACYVPGSGQVLLRPARPETLVHELVAELPEWHTVRAQSLSVPESELSGSGGAEGFRGDARRLNEIFQSARIAGGQLSVGGGAGRVVTFVDTTERGRWLTYLTEDAPGARYVVAQVGTFEALAGKLEQLRASR